MTKEIKILGAVTIIVFAIIALLIKFSPTAGAPADASKLVHANSHMTGSAGAKVTLVEFGDFQCPSCAAAHPIIKEVTDMYKNEPNFNFVFRNFPLPQHPNAIPAAQAAEAAGLQGKYWEMFDLIYQHQTDWAESAKGPDIFKSYAQQLKLDMNKYAADLDSSAVNDAIAIDKADANTLGVNSTPTFYLNGVLTVGVPEFNGLKQKIDDLLKK